MVINSSSSSTVKNRSITTILRSKSQSSPQHAPGLTEQGHRHLSETAVLLEDTPSSS